MPFAFSFAEEAPIEALIYGKVTAPNGGSVKLYQLPGEYRPVVTALANGTALLVEFEGSTWHKVSTTTGGFTGWIKASEMSITTRGRALKLIESGMVTLLGSDAHNLTNRRPNLGPARAVIERKLGRQMLSRLDGKSQALLREAIEK